MTADAVELQRKAERLAERGVFLGCQPRSFPVGRQVLDQLVKYGLQPDMKVVDVGCGVLRVGWWLINYLQPERYFGIEPRSDALELAIDELLDEDVVAQKHPRFDHNDQFDLSVFGQPFDVVLAWSVWTHASKRQIIALLDSFVATRSEGGWLMANYWPAQRSADDYKRDEWQGRSHQSDTPGLSRHTHDWLDAAVAARGLSVVEQRRWGTRGKWMVVLR